MKTCKDIPVLELYALLDRYLGKVIGQKKSFQERGQKKDAFGKCYRVYDMQMERFRQEKVAYARIRREIWHLRFGPSRLDGLSVESTAAAAPARGRIHERYRIR